MNKNSINIHVSVEICKQSFIDLYRIQNRLRFTRHVSWLIKSLQFVSQTKSMDPSTAPRLLTTKCYWQISLRILLDCSTRRYETSSLLLLLNIPCCSVHILWRVNTIAVLNEAVYLNIINVPKYIICTETFQFIK